jgi:acyl-CoA reductase-like NAD-dependent aldehyde dehydrogenase
MNTQLLIGAKETPASGGKTFDRLNPVTGECATRAAAASVEDSRRVGLAQLKHHFATFAHRALVKYLRHRARER